MKRALGVVACLSLVATTGCRKKLEYTGAPQRSPMEGASGVTTTSGASQAADDGLWTMPAKDYANTRFSRLTEITTDNVKDLRLVWSQKTGLERGHEAAPLVVGDTMYVTTPYPNKLFACDLTKPGSPPKWIYEPKPVPAAQGVACCDVVNRGAVFHDGKIIFNTLDVQTVAVDAKTGAEVWRTKLGDVSRGETMTMAPLVVPSKTGPKVLVGNSGGEMGVRGWITALDVNDGKIAWRAWSTGPDTDVLIGPEFKPHYAQDVGKDLGVTSWPPGKWEVGGGTVWGLRLVRPRARPPLLRYGEPRAVERGAARRRQQVDRRRVRATPLGRRRDLVLSIRAARPLRPRRRQRARPRRHDDQGTAPQGAAHRATQRLRLRHRSRER